MQQNVLHLLRGLERDCRKVPASNLIFARSKGEEEISAEIPALADACWPFHRAVIGRLGVRVVLCLGRDAEREAIAWLEADDRGAGKFSEVDSFTAEYGLKVTSRIFRNRSGVVVVQLPHPSRFIWTHTKSDPSELVLRALRGE